MADKVIIWPNPQSSRDTYYWVEEDNTNDPDFTTDLNNAKRYDEGIVEDVVNDINAANQSLQVYSGNPVSPPPPPPGL